MQTNLNINVTVQVICLHLHEAKISLQILVATHVNLCTLYQVQCPRYCACACACWAASRGRVGLVLGWDQNSDWMQAGPRAGGGVTLYTITHNAPTANFLLTLHCDIPLTITIRPLTAQSAACCGDG